LHFNYLSPSSDLFYYRFVFVCLIPLLQLCVTHKIDDSGYQRDESLLLTKLINSQQDAPSHGLKVNQSVELETTDKSEDQSYVNSKNQPKPKYVNKSSSNVDKKNTFLLRKSLNLGPSRFAGSIDSWKCPNITDNRSLECGCDVPLTLRCSGDVHGLNLIAVALRNSNSSVSILDCTLRNVTVLNEARIFENVSISGLFISSGEIKRVHRLAFSGLQTPLQILGLPNNALTSVPSNSLQQLTYLDRLDLSNNDIKVLSPTDFVPLSKLTYLELSENQISSISQKTFLPLRNLVTLKLNGNKLGDSPGSLKTLAECLNLRDLDLKSNLIKGSLKSSMLPVLKELENLNLERNSFSSVEKNAFKSYPRLQTLILRHNQIDVLQDDAFYGLSSLQKLDLSYNGIVAVSGGSLKHMNRLTLLDFTHNFLR
jgi:Leucine-rich repeat (LRR) protein